MQIRIWTARLNDVDPVAWLTDALDRIPNIRQTRLDELQPWHWKATRLQSAAEQLAA